MGFIFDKAILNLGIFLPIIIEERSEYFLYGEFIYFFKEEAERKQYKNRKVHRDD